jgi:two-component sensor histidine kinase
MFKFRALQAYIAPHIRCYAAKTTKPVGDTNQALMNALQESQRRLTAIQPVKNEIEQSKSTAVTKSKPLLKDITHIVKKETRGTSNKEFEYLHFQIPQ